MLYLYFGKTEVDLKNFALQDLGILRTNRETSFSARFTDAKEALASFHYSQILDSLEDGSEAVHRRAAIDVLAGPACMTQFAADLRSRAAHQTGLFFEKAGQSDLARQLYRAGPSPDCNERLFRVLYNTGHKAEAETLLQRMIDDPASDGEHLFATDFHARKFGGERTGLCTELLHDYRRRHLSRQSQSRRRRRAAARGYKGILHRECLVSYYAHPGIVTDVTTRQVSA